MPKIAERMIEKNSEQLQKTPLVEWFQAYKHLIGMRA